MATSEVFDWPEVMHRTRPKGPRTPYLAMAASLPLSRHRRPSARSLPHPGRLGPLVQGQLRSNRLWDGTPKQSVPVSQTILNSIPSGVIFNALEVRRSIIQPMCIILSKDLSGCVVYLPSPGARSHSKFYYRNLWCSVTRMRGRQNWGRPVVVVFSEAARWRHRARSWPTMAQRGRRGKPQHCVSSARYPLLLHVEYVNVYWWCIECIDTQTRGYHQKFKQN